MTIIAKQYQLNYFDPSENSNKVWKGFAFADGTFRTEFGRVRDGGLGMMNREKKLGNEAAAVSLLESKRLEKIKKGYRDSQVLTSATEIVVAKPTDLKAVAASQIAGAGDKTTADLIAYLADVNIHQITHATSIRYNAASGAFSTPLGILTPAAVSDARDILGKIETANANRNFSRSDFVRDYFSLVPSDFGAKIPAVDVLLNDAGKIKAQSQILDALDAALQQSAPTSQSDKTFACRLTKLPHWTEDGRAKFREIKNLYEKSKGGHTNVSSLKLIRVYEIEIDAMKQNFDQTAARIGNVRSDLWHGTKASNLLSILKGGLQIPKAGSAHCTGRMFGDGVYSSIQSTKALNYATDFWNRAGGRNQRTFMFLCDAALGKMCEPKMRNSSFPRKGFDSTWVAPGSCGVMNHEAVVYDTAQINLRYLCEFGN